MAASPFALGALALRPAWRIGWRERLGGGPRPIPGCVWLHAASLGEARAALRLAEELEKSGSAVYTSSTTVSGRELLVRVRSKDACSLAPLDHPWCVETALTRVAPDVLALVETELWPNWIGAALRRRIPVVIVSGRLSDRVFPRYLRLRRLFRGLARQIAAVGARSGTDAERFAALGIPAQRIRVTGDLKLDSKHVTPPIAADLARILDGAPPLFVAGSTHPGEEEALRATLMSCRSSGLAVAFVLAPRAPSRARVLERGLRKAGLLVRRRSDPVNGPLRTGEVLLLDTLGELAAVYSRAVISFVGGSLAPIGGHNLLEPIAVGSPVIFGPHLANVRELAEVALQSGSGEVVNDAGELSAAVLRGLRDPAAARARAASGRELLSSHRGSAQRSAALIRATRPDIDAYLASAPGRREKAH
ncbi:MAG: glycosyltransferase N-terminal domain-containing protein [Myxococcota bacterium]